MKRATLALAGLLAVSAGAYASDSWNNGIGPVNAFTTDETSFTSLPQSITLRKNTLFIEDINGYSNGGLNAAVLGGTLGVWVNRGDTNFSDLYDINAGLFSTVTPDHRIDLTYAFDVNDKTLLAIGVNRAYFSEKQVTAYDQWWQNYEVNANAMGLNLGVDVKELAFFKLVQLGLQYQLENQSYKTLAGSTSVVEDQKTDFSGLGLRLGADLAGENGRFGRLELGLNSRNGKGTSSFLGPTAEEKASHLGYNVGYAAGVSGEKGLLLAGAMYYGYSDKRDYTANNDGTYQVDETHLLLSFGGEAKVNDWLTVRGGVGSDVLSTHDHKEDADYTGSGLAHSFSSSDYGWGSWGAAGASIGLGAFTLDGVLGTNGWFADTFQQISLSYSWQ